MVKVVAAEVKTVFRAAASLDVHIARSSHELGRAEATVTSCCLFNLLEGRVFVRARKSPEQLGSSLVKFLHFLTKV